VSETTRQELLSKAQQQGYDTMKLIWRTEDSAIGKATR
jgi:apolipoprotein D and lipocalin family protein